MCISIAKLSRGDQPIPSNPRHWFAGEEKSRVRAGDCGVERYLPRLYNTHTKDKYLLDPTLSWVAQIQVNPTFLWLFFFFFGLPFPAARPSRQPCLPQQFCWAALRLDVPMYLFVVDDDHFLLTAPPPNPPARRRNATFLSPGEGRGGGHIAALSLDVACQRWSPHHRLIVCTRNPFGARDNTPSVVVEAQHSFRSTHYC